MATSVFAENAGGARSSHPLAEINITPLVDVMLVLLIIFMVTAPLLTRTIDLGLPQSGGSLQLDRISLVVNADGTYLLDGAPVASTGLSQALAQTARNAPETVLEISASGEADYQAFTGALATARSSGLTRIGLATR